MELLEPATVHEQGRVYGRHELLPEDRSLHYAAVAAAYPRYSFRNYACVPRNFELVPLFQDVFDEEAGLDLGAQG